MAYVGGGVFGGTGCEVLVAIKLGDLEANIMVETQLREARSFISLTLRMVASPKVGKPTAVGNMELYKYGPFDSDTACRQNYKSKYDCCVTQPAMYTNTHTRTQTRRCHYVMCVFDT